MFHVILYPDLRFVLLCMEEELYREFNRLILFNLFNTLLHLVMDSKNGIKQIVIIIIVFWVLLLSSMLCG